MAKRLCFARWKKPILAVEPSHFALQQDSKWCSSYLHLSAFFRIFKWITLWIISLCRPCHPCHAMDFSSLRRFATGIPCATGARRGRWKISWTTHVTWRQVGRMEGLEGVPKPRQSWLKELQFHYGLCGHNICMYVYLYIILYIYRVHRCSWGL